MLDGGRKGNPKNIKSLNYKRIYFDLPVWLSIMETD